MSDHTAATAAPALAAAAGWVDPETDDTDMPVLEESTDTVRPDIREGEGEGAAAEAASAGLAKLELNKKPDVFHLHLGHQETDRILDEIDGYCETVLESAGDNAWMPADGLAKLMLKELGYEDMDQFEGAMGGTFEQFIKALPHIETKIQDDGSSCDGMLVLKMTPPPAVKQGFTMTIPIKTSEDLWVTLYKAPDCVISIPEIDFEIGHSAKRELDAIYNHITKAMFNLSQHASQNFVQGDTKDKILDTVEHLSRFLDIDHPWQLVLRDPSGRSILKPMGDNVSLVYDDLPNAAGQA